MNRKTDSAGKTAGKGRKADAAELAAQLRANLRRRKQQLKARQAGSGAEVEDAG